MATTELLRSNRRSTLKKQVRIDSLVAKIKALKAAKSESVAMKGELDGLTATIGGLALAAQTNLNNDPVIVAGRSEKNIKLINANARVTTIRAQIDSLDKLVQADADYTLTEKQEYTDAKANEV